MSAPMMACGCAAATTCSARNGVTYDPPIPSCFTHNCIEIAEVAPDLTGRRARCSYFGKGGFSHYECNYAKQTGCTRRECACEMPSGTALPFFKYHGPGSHEALDRCKHCNFWESAHSWHAVESTIRSSWRRPRDMTSVVAKTRACAHFDPLGDVGFDSFYCGCAGWD